ncbi:hypothetical protein CALVIDRAFT_306664 [Calocera viscosa TUFC12733]|uniref:Uncharacterized protein n=1 Tax=Calocera viscosa (strain TUFC12733) TaxID=1330018 RepID=A0A167IAX0_CALVF|nr:hypothetical protein CALVIDRAFT_306664 [Calocera viscosa TUFC12733]
MTLIYHLYRLNCCFTSAAQIFYITCHGVKTPLLEVETVLKILPWIGRVADSICHFDRSYWCIRLLQVHTFHEALSDIMAQPALLDISTFTCIAGLLKSATLRLMYDPFDELFPSLQALPWVSVACANLPLSHLRFQLDILRSIATGRLVVRLPTSEHDALFTLPIQNFTIDEAQTILHLLVRALCGAPDKASASICITLLKSVAFRIIFLKAFTANDLDDDQFDAVARICFLSWSPLEMTPLQTELAETSLVYVSLDEQINHIYSRLPHSANDSRFYPLLRLLAHRMNRHPEEKPTEDTMERLIRLVSEHVTCQWVASQHNIGDLVQNSEVLEGALRQLKSRKHITSDSKFHALRVMVAAYRVSGGNDGLLDDILMQLDQPDIEVFCFELQETSNPIQTLAAFWELMLYRIRFEAIRNTGPHTVIGYLVDLALSTMPFCTDEAAYVALLMLQFAYTCLVADSQRALFVALTQWFASHPVELESLGVEPLSKSAGTPVQPNMALLDNFRHTLSEQRVALGTVSSASGKIHLFPDPGDGYLEPRGHYIPVEFKPGQPTRLDATFRQAPRIGARYSRARPVPPSRHPQSPSYPSPFPSRQPVYPYPQSLPQSLPPSRIPSPSSPYQRRSPRTYVYPSYTLPPSLPPSRSPSPPFPPRVSSPLAWLYSPAQPPSVPPSRASFPSFPPRSPSPRAQLSTTPSYRPPSLPPSRASFPSFPPRSPSPRAQLSTTPSYRPPSLPPSRPSSPSFPPRSPVLGAQLTSPPLYLPTSLPPSRSPSPSPSSQIPREISRVYIPNSLQSILPPSQSPSPSSPSQRPRPISPPRLYPAIPPYRSRNPRSQPQRREPSERPLNPAPPDYSNWRSPSEAKFPAQGGYDRSRQNY